jgi:hypothetical protein
MGYTAADATEAEPTPTPIDFASYASTDFVQCMDGIERAATAAIFAIRIHPPMDGCPGFPHTGNENGPVVTTMDDWRRGISREGAARGLQDGDRSGTLIECSLVTRLAGTHGNARTRIDS